MPWVAACVFLGFLASPISVAADSPSTTTTNAVLPRFLVRFRPGVPSLRQDSALHAIGLRIKSIHHCGPAPLTAAAARLVSSSIFRGLAVVQLENPRDLPAAMTRARRHPDVLYVEPDYRLRIDDANPADVVPDDFNFTDQWHLQNTGQNNGLPGADISAPAAWEISTGDRRVKVAVIDTGIDYYHPDLADNVWTNPREVEGNGVDDDDNGFVDDFYGYDFANQDSDPMDDQLHGTHVAGIIGAMGNNRIGVSGVCWQVTLMAIKAFDDHGNASSSDVIDAIHYAMANGAQIINASWGQKEKSLALQEAIQEAHDAGLVIIASAGNDHSGTLQYPAAYSNVVAVASTGNRDQPSTFSNFGTFVSLAAPGELVLSTVPNAGYDVLSGTSMSAPQVTGAAALVLALHPDFRNSDIEAILRNSVDWLSGNLYIGAGRLNLRKALEVQVPLPTVAIQVPSLLSGPVDIFGTCIGEHFSSYTVEIGPGTYPTNWTLLTNATTPVQNGPLVAGYSTAYLTEGAYTVRLTGRDSYGQSASALAPTTVQNVYLSSPMHNDVLRAGDPVAFRGTVFGASRSYILEQGIGLHPNLWSTNGFTLADGGQRQVVGGLLGTLDTTVLTTNEFYTFRLTALTNGQVAEQWTTYLVYFDGNLRPGWPQYVAMSGDYPTNDWRAVTVADLDGDGLQEIIRVDPGNSDGKPATLIVYNFNGTVRWTRTLDSGEPFSDVPVVGDIDHDGTAEIFVDVGDKKQLFAFHHDGSPLGGQWPVQLEVGNLGKVLADLRGDGQLELIGYAQDAVLKGGQYFRQLIVIDATGQVLRKWDIPDCSDAIDAPRMAPAVGRLDDSLRLQIVAPFGCSSVAAFSLDRIDGPRWSARMDGEVFGSPVIGDLTNSGKNDIVVGAYDSASGGGVGTHGGVYVFDRDGSRWPGWPVLVDESFSATPALADFDFDGNLEIVIPSWRSQMLHVLGSDGFDRKGWPLGPFNSTVITTDPLVTDINGDGSLDVVLESPGRSLLVATSDDYSYVGGVIAFNSDGSQIALNPNPSLNSLVMESTGGTRFKAFPLTVTDLDHNGRLDVVAATIQDRAYAPLAPITTDKNRYSIYAWELNTPYVATNLVWPTFQRNPQHTGYYPPLHPRYQPPVVARIPDQTVRIGSPFFPIHLDNFVNDPDNTPAQMTWRVGGSKNLKVKINTQRNAVVSPVDPQWTGEEELQFTATDPSGLSDTTSATFAVRVDYQPPMTAADSASTLQNQPVEIDVLANDSDPRGYPLTVVDLSRPLHGSAKVTTAGTILYTPKANYHGEDEFTYVVSNGRDGMALGDVSIEVERVETPPTATPDRGITLENTSTTVDVLANDQDPDGDLLSIVSFSQPINGSVQLSPPGLFTYTPSPSFNGMDSFIYTITDGNSNQSTASVTIMVKPVNQPPVAKDLSYTLNRNTQQDIIFSAADPDGDGLTFTVVKGPDHGTLWNYPDLATYYPTKGFSGIDTVTYQASDGITNSSVATATLKVLPIDNPPQATKMSVHAKPGQPRPVALQATDLDDDPLSFHIAQQPQHGSLTGANTNYVYTASKDYLGDDSFTYVVSDGQLSSAETTVQITVSNQNTAPAAESVSVAVLPGTATQFVLRADDPEADPLVYELVSEPRYGQISGFPPNLTYSPPADFVGYDKFTFKASDGSLWSDPATVTLSVFYPNQAPVTTNQNLTIPPNQPAVVLLSVTDADFDPLRFALLKGPHAGRLTGLGTNLTYTPQPGYVGTDMFTYKIWDGHTYSAVATVGIYITGVQTNPPPSFQAIKLLDNGTVELSLASMIGKPLVIQSSTNLIDWTYVASVNPNSSPTLLTDTNTLPFSAVFYRAILP